MNSIECLPNEKEKDLRACLEDLDKLKEIPPGEYTFEELKKNTLAKKPKVELKVLPPYLKYFFCKRMMQNQSSLVMLYLQMKKLNWWRQ